MQQSESKDHCQQVGRLHVKDTLEPAIVVEALVNNADGNDGVYKVVVPGDLVVGRKDQRDAVPNREDGDEFRNILEAGQKKHHTKQEQHDVPPDLSST